MHSSFWDWPCAKYVLGASLCCDLRELAIWVFPLLASLSVPRRALSADVSRKTTCASIIQEGRPTCRAFLLSKLWHSHRVSSTEGGTVPCGCLSQERHLLPCSPKGYRLTRSR